MSRLSLYGRYALLLFNVGAIVIVNGVSIICEKWLPYDITVAGSE